MPHAYDKDTEKDFANRWLKAKALFVRLATNWYVLGLVGWGIVAWNYPIEDILPRYAF